MIPEGFHTVTPYLSIERAHNAMSFYKTAFGAEEMTRHNDPDDGKIRHAQFKIGDSAFMISDYFGEFEYMKSAQMYGGSPVSMFLYVEDAQAVFDAAVAAGATAIDTVKEQSYGKSGGVQDPFGIIWWVCTAPATA